MRLKYFLIVSNYAIDNGFQEALQHAKRPLKVGGVETPSTLNDLSLGELMQLQGISSEREMILVPCKVLLGLDERKVMRSEAYDVLAFVFWAAREVERINKLFASTNVPPTPEEKQAGADKMNFGMFGLIDYYAQRMGITDHEAVEYVPWVRVYKCLDMDAQRIRMDRRLRKVLERRKK